MAKTGNHAKKGKILSFDLMAGIIVGAPPARSAVVSSKVPIARRQPDRPGRPWHPPLLSLSTPLVGTLPVSKTKT
jgi:hypothetical protein